MSIGTALADERRRRSLTTRHLADRARLSPATVNNAEAGHRVSLDAYARLATAFGLPLEVVVCDPRTNRSTARGDLVHAAMGEYEARLLGSLGYRVSIDHPYQHYQFAGRADVLAWSAEARVLLHIENRTQFPNLQEAAGSFNAKRQYLAPVVARQVELPRFETQTHVMVGLWSAEVLRAVRTNAASFAALCPDGDEAWTSLLRGDPVPHGSTATLVLLDPFATGRQRAFLSFAEALAGARSRLRGYADAAARLRSRGPT